jgi:hypothetical protein
VNGSKKLIFYNLFFSPWKETFTVRVFEMWYNSKSTRKITSFFFSSSRVVCVCNEQIRKCVGEDMSVRERRHKIFRNLPLFHYWAINFDRLIL